MSAQRENFISSSKLSRLRRVAGEGARGPSKSLEWTNQVFQLRQPTMKSHAPGGASASNSQNRKPDRFDLTNMRILLTAFSGLSLAQTS